MTPVLSVVIPCFNDGAYLMEAVASAQLNQLGRHEVIVVNDGSNDPKTLEFLRLLSEGKSGTNVQVINQPNRGVSAARNQGIAAACGRYILPLDADNRIRPAYIDRGIEVLEDNASVEVVYGDAEYFGIRSGRWQMGRFDILRLLQGNYIDNCAVFRKTAWERCGGYDEAMPVQGWEDWDFWLRIACAGGGFRHLDEVLFDYRVRPGSLSSCADKPESRLLNNEHVYAKRVPVTIGDCLKWANYWEPMVGQFRARPLRTVRTLFLRAYLPTLRARLLKFRKRRYGF